MTGPLHIGHSVRLLRVGDLAEALGVSRQEIEVLLSRLDILHRSGYVPDDDVINMAAFEAAVFADLSPEMPPDIIRLYQAIAALDHIVLDKTALRKRLAAYLRYMNRSPRGGRIKES